VGRFANCFDDGRAAGLVEHTVKAMVAQRVYGIALGYEDTSAARGWGWVSSHEPGAPKHKP